MRLQDKFKRVFIFPLICGIIISIILTVVILILYSQYFTDSNLINRLQQIEDDKVVPIIYTANNFIYKKFQKPIYGLQILRKYYNFYSQNIGSKTIMSASIPVQNTLINGLKIYENYASTINKLEQNGNSTYLDYAYWFYDNNATDYSLMTNQIQTKLLILANMIPVMKSIYEVSKNNLANRMDLIYYANKHSNLFFSYPIYKNNQNFFKIFQNFTTPPDCKDMKGNNPNYFTFSCRDWWQQVLESVYTPQEQDIVITHPYQFAGLQKYGITVCIKFTDANIVSDNPEDLLSVICMDIDISDMINAFDTFNKQLAGYFYILRIGSDIPIYYPMILKSNYFSNIERFEYDIDTPFYIDELAQFANGVVPVLTAKYNNCVKNITCPYRSLNGTYVKNAKVNDFFIFPVGLYTDDTNPSKAYHILSIIQIAQPNSMQNNIQNFQYSLYPRLIIQIFLFIIMGAILVLIAWYLIISIATNIVKPIKNLKYLIQGMNINTGQFEDDLSINEDSENSPLKKNKNSEITEDDNKILEPKSKSADYDEETLEMRSAEMDKLFDMLLMLKNVLSFTTNNKLIYDKAALVNFVNAKYTFREVKNLKGENVCDSNVGNLALRCKKYDKAIFHMIEAIRDSKKDTSKYKIGPENILDTINDYLKILQNNQNNNKTSKFSKRSARGGPFRSTLNKRSDSHKIHLENEDDGAYFSNHPITQKNKNLMLLVESRYPKLLYAYKQFFKSFKKVVRSISEESNKGSNFSLGNNYNGNLKVYEAMMGNDLYVIKDRHSLEPYELFIIDYINVSISLDDSRRTAEAILEYIEFLITYKLKIDEDFSTILENIQINIISQGKSTSSNNLSHIEKIRNSKTQVLKLICELFNHFDVIYESLRNNCSSEYFKTFLDLLRNNKKENLENVETPFLILHQKSNYLKGKVAKLCGHYDKALEYFHHSRETLIVCDASIIKKSIYQIINIMEFLKEKIEKEIQHVNETNGKYLYYSDNNKDRSNSEIKLNLPNTEKRVRETKESLKSKIEKIEQYISSNTNHLDNFTKLSKDLVVLIDISDSMRSDSKNLERAFNGARSFFDLYITTDDRFALFSYSSSINPIISLTQKNYHTYAYVKRSIDNIQSDPFTWLKSAESKNQRSRSCTCKAITLVYDYLNKKTLDTKVKEKWIIVFTNRFDLQDNSVEDQRIFKDFQNATSEYINVVIVGINMDKDTSLMLKSSLIKISKKSDFIDIDNITNFAQILKMHGDVRNEFDYPNERYESDKIKQH